MKDSSLDFSMSLFSGAMLEKQITNDILDCNDTSSAYGLTLTQTQAEALIKTRTDTLKNTGRIEFKGGVIAKIIRNFCDSPYISKDSYESTLNSLIELFYSFKNETYDLLSDDELIEIMKKEFNEKCFGSIELLEGKMISDLSRKLNFEMYNVKESEEESEDISDDESETQE